MNNILQLILMTLAPVLELRASIPYGILKLNMDWMLVFIICTISNIMIGPAVYFFLDKVMHIFLRIEWINKSYSRYVDNTRKKMQQPIEKYEYIGLAIFIGIPLPGTGVYTGALAAYLLKTGYKKLMYATILGVLIAGIIVTVITLTGSEAFYFLIKY
jgi:uncharacterized membrane protein